MWNLINDYIVKPIVKLVSSLMSCLFPISPNVDTRKTEQETIVETTTTATATTYGTFTSNDDSTRINTEQSSTRDKNLSTTPAVQTTETNDDLLTNSTTTTKTNDDLLTNSTTQIKKKMKTKNPDKLVFYNLQGVSTPPCYTAVKPKTIYLYKISDDVFEFLYRKKENMFKFNVTKSNLGDHAKAIDNFVVTNQFDNTKAGNDAKNALFNITSRNGCPFNHPHTGENEMKVILKEIKKGLIEFDSKQSAVKPKKTEEKLKIKTEETEKKSKVKVKTEKAERKSTKLWHLFVDFGLKLGSTNKDDFGAINIFLDKEWRNHRIKELRQFFIECSNFKMVKLVEQLQECSDTVKLSQPEVIDDQNNKPPKQEVKDDQKKKSPEQKKVPKQPPTIEQEIQEISGEIKKIIPDNPNQNRAIKVFIEAGLDIKSKKEEKVKTREILIGSDWRRERIDELRDSQFFAAKEPSLHHKLDRLNECYELYFRRRSQLGTSAGLKR